jgi:hypothetical protein
MLEDADGEDRQRHKGKSIAAILVFKSIAAILAFKSIAAILEFKRVGAILEQHIWLYMIWWAGW